MKKDNSRTGLEIAIIGMAGKFPEAKNTDELWINLKNGKESISFFTKEEMENERIGPIILDPNYVNAKGIIEDLEYFDEAFFDLTPVEAQVIDPQIRVFLEISEKALENSGYAGKTYKGRIGVYSGTSFNLFWNASVLLQSEVGAFMSNLLSNKDYVSMLTSYKLDLKGPSMSLFSACSTSLVAVDLACRGLLTGECDIALAGGITITLPKKAGYMYQEGMLFSKDGHCRTFDEKASGTVFGHGAGVVVLKPLENAIEDGDSILAVIKGTAVTNDGIDKVGMTAPTVEGQAAAARAALHFAEVEAESISFVETHGTGTILGDPIEIEALSLAFNSDKKGFCRIGSVKTNVGHLDCAAGITGLIKTVLALKHRLIPPSLHFETPNPKIDFENSPFRVNTELVEWKSEEYPLRAGVNSLGIGGTNAHVILEEAPEIGVSSESRPQQLLLFSAKTDSALNKISENFVEFLKENPGVNLADAAYTLKLGRKVFEFRKMLVCSNSNKAVNTLPSNDPKNVHTFLSKESNRLVIFLFPGQGAQYVNMGLDLYRTEPVFRRELDRCLDILKSIMEYDIKEILYSGNESKDGEENTDDRSNLIKQTEITQPVLFIFEYAIAKLLMEWGISPYAMIGHSIGEYVAACLSGVFSLEDALEIVVLRGKLMQELPGGSMLSVSISEEELKPLLNEDISLAAVNSSSLCTISGTYDAIDNFSKLLEEKGYKNKKLYTSHAFHSKMMDPILGRFEEKVKTIALKKPQIPFISNVSGNWITVEDSTDPGYWVKHIRNTVRFADGVQMLLKEEKAIFVEVGPGRVLSTLVRQHQDKKSNHLIVNLVRHPKENVTDDYFLLSKIGQLWLYGQEIDWDAFYQEEKRHRIPLPTYPFERNYYEIPDNPFALFRKSLKSEVEKKADLGDWFHFPSWNQSMLPVLNEDIKFYNYLLFMDDSGLGSRLVRILEKNGHDVVMVKRGSQFHRESNQVYIINPEKGDDYDTLFKNLKKEDRMPNSIVHMWSVNEIKNELVDLVDEVETQQALGYYSLLYMLQAIGKRNYNEKIRIIVMANNMYDPFGDNQVAIGKSTLIGPVRLIPREYSNMSCHLVDIIIPKPGTPDEDMLIDQLYAEVSTDTSDDVIAYRKNMRWLQSYKTIRWEKSEEMQRLRQEGVYLITGGLGGIGLVLAGHLAKSLKAKLILIARSSLPAREDWEEWLKTHEKDDSISNKIIKVQELEEVGAEVMVAGVNITDYEGMQTVVTQALDRFGRIDGVVHSAGIIDFGGVIQRRTREASEKVFEAKVEGTLVLDRVLKDVKLDFFVFCSSINSILGPFGEVGYTSANAFMDAFAYYKSKNSDTYITAINWDLWLEVGMISNTQIKANKSESFKPETKKATHPLFDQYIKNKPGEEIFLTMFNADKHWVVSEHKILGNSVMVGTAYLEMVKSAFENHAKAGTVEIRDLYFLNPFVISKNTELEFRLVLRERKDSFEYWFMSKRSSEKDKWKPHARGEILAVGEEPPKKYNLEEIKARCNLQEIVIPKEDEHKPFGDFVIVSHRWRCLRHIFLGKDEGIARLELPEEYAEDIDHYSLHPSLLDASTGILLPFIEKKENFLPVSYKKLRVKGRLPRVVYSYVKHIEDDSSPGEILKFNITIMDENGTELLDIEDYTLLSISERGKVLADEQRAQFSLPDFLADIDNDSNIERGFQYETKYSQVFGIAPEEGVEIFLRVLGGSLPQVIIATQDIETKLDWLKNPPKKASSESLVSKAKVERPDLETVYVAPRNKTEEMIASIFTKYIGVAEIGVHDDLFELGVDSLKAVDIAASITKQFELEFPIAELFNNTTIEEIAKLIEDKKKESDLVIIDVDIDKKESVMDEQ